MLEYFYLSQGAIAASASSSAASARASAQSASHGVDRLEQRQAAMELAMETLIRAVIRKGLMTEEEFFKLAREIDAEDGVVDGRRDLNKLRKMCPQCRKASPSERPRCMWCGTDLFTVKAELPVF